MQAVNKWRLVIQPEGEGYLLELLRRRYFLDGKFVDIWLAPPRAATGAYSDIEITCRPNPGHFYRLNTGTVPVEQRMSESLNFKGLWPQEVYVYIREFQHAIRSYVENTFHAEIKRIESGRKREQEASRIAIFHHRERKRLIGLRRAKVSELLKTSATAFGIAVELNVPIHTVYSDIKALKSEAK